MNVVFVATSRFLGLFSDCWISFTKFLFLSNSNSISTSCGAWHDFQFQLMSPVLVSQITRCLYLCMNTLVSLPLLLPFITWLDRSWHVGRWRHLNAGNWQAIAAPGPRRCSFFLPFRSFIISYTTAGGWWLSEDFVMNTPPAESLWDGLANQEMVGRSASLTDRKWCN